MGRADRAVLRRRLLLVLFALGTNVGSCEVDRLMAVL
ncbi:hypothetical protein BH18ACT4_BH18ACT4_05030 [soil metagenome]